MVDKSADAYLLGLKVDQLREDSNDVFSFLLFNPIEDQTELLNTLSNLQRQLVIYIPQLNLLQD
jgi:hypothetical protein